MAEIIPRAKARPPWWINAVLATALIFLAIAIGGQFFFRASVNNLNREIENVGQKISDLKTPANEELEQRIMGYQIQFQNFDRISSDRYFASRALGLLEETVHPEVVYQNLSVDAEEGRMIMTAAARTYGVIGEQLLIFNNDERFRRVESGNYSRDREGKITFRLMLAFDPAIIQ